jgi:hypothetical protein
MSLLARLPGRSDVLVAASGLLFTLLGVLTVAQNGAAPTFALLLGLMLFGAFVAGFALTPHVFVPLAIVYLASLSALEVFSGAELGASKDLITVAAVIATVGLLIRRGSTRLDLGTLLLLGLILGLYIVNLGGALSGETGHGSPWFHGVRLFAEPLCLFIFGTSVRNPHKTLVWSVWALIGVCIANALYGLLQQALGLGGLFSLGYQYGVEVRQISGHIRSFGTVAEPFSYAGLLLLGICALLLWARASARVTLAVALVGVGLLVSYVRTAALIALAILGLAAARRGHGRYAIPLTLAAAAAAAAVFAGASQENATRSVQLNSTTYLTLNGRTNIWKYTLNSPADWLVGRGVGATGTASQRATRALASRSVGRAKGGSVVDSSYFVVIADIGLLGLGLLLAFFGRILVKARAAVRRGERSGWLAIGLLTVTILDALTRESFTGFPTAYISMLLIGVAWATWVEKPPESVAAPAQP